MGGSDGTFEGRLNAAAAEISGTWTQGMPMPLVLKRVDKPTHPNRPQEPKPPFSYRSEDVAITNAPGQEVLAGTLTIPEGAGPFLVLADRLSRRGIAVLRYDDRGAGRSGRDHHLDQREDRPGEVTRLPCLAKLAG